MSRSRRIPPRPVERTRSVRPRPAASGRGVSGSALAERRTGRRGFTLIEVAVVIVIIGLLAAMAITTYRMMTNKARMTQAKTMLGHLTKTETIYFSDHGRYTENISLLSFESVGYKYYEVSVALDNDAMNYTGTATGVGVMAGDRWYVTKDRNPYQDNTSPFK